MIRCPFMCGHYDASHRLIICRPSGKLTAAQMSDITSCRGCVVNHGLQQVNRFHDLSAITSVDLCFQDVHHLCKEEAASRQQTGPIKACYLVPNALLFGTVRMYQSLIEGSGVEVHVHYDIDVLADALDVDAALLKGEPPRENPATDEQPCETTP